MSTRLRKAVSVLNTDTAYNFLFQSSELWSGRYVIKEHVSWVPDVNDPIRESHVI